MVLNRKIRGKVVLNKSSGDHLDDFHCTAVVSYKAGNLVAYKARHLPIRPDTILRRIQRSERLRIRDRSANHPSEARG